MHIHIVVVTPITTTMAINHTIDPPLPLVSSRDLRVVSALQLVVKHPILTHPPDQTNRIPLLPSRQ